MNSPSEPSREAAIAIYQSDQARISAIGSAALTMLGAGLAYVVATLPFTGSLVKKIASLTNHTHMAAGIFLYSLPSLLWVIAAYHCLLTLEAMMRTISARVIEQQLSTDAQLKHSNEGIAFGFEASDSVIDFRQQPLRHKLLSLISFGGIFIVICTYTVVMLVLGAHYIWWIPAAVIYGLVFCLVIYSWIRGIRRATKHQNKAGIGSKRSRKSLAPRPGGEDLQGVSDKATN
jgi:hypothetical protein